ncbi:MAG: hypothetical protein QME65_06230 [Candidatus Omnitrophota bacterium]|nr:hypothetical protein [Candidatus Omnitrophota bacterium]
MTIINKYWRERMFFRPKIENEDSLYSRIRDCSRYVKIRKQIEAFWETYKSIAPKGFLQEVQKKNCFHSRWWEMYCGVGLKRIGIDIRTSKANKGPDFQFVKNGKRYYIEAIAPSAGNTIERLPPIEYGDENEVKVLDLPEEEFLLRITSAISEKLKKYQQYLKNEMVTEDDILIIAISSCNLHQYGSLMDYPVPAPLKVLKGFGCEYIDLMTGERGIVERENISKKSGERVDVKLFEREDMRIISAVLYSNSDPLNSPDEPEQTFFLL